MRNFFPLKFVSLIIGLASLECFGPPLESLPRKIAGAGGGRIEGDTLPLGHHRAARKRQERKKKAKEYFFITKGQARGERQSALFAVASF